MVVIVTGGNRGLGLAICEGLAADGFDVVPTDSSNCNLRNEATIKAFMGRFPIITALINCAAVYEPGTIEETYSDVWRRVIDINLTGAFLMTREVLPKMVGYGRIINIGSFGGVAGPCGSAAYNASKAGLIGLTKSTANENIKRGITCNMVAPGAIDTGIFKRFDDDHKKRLLKRIPAGRPAKVSEIVNPVRWLASYEASYLTGQIINVNGGLT